MLLLVIHLRNGLEAANAKTQGNHAKGEFVTVFRVTLPIVGHHPFGGANRQ